MKFIASIVSIFAAVHFVRDLLRDKRNARLRSESAYTEITADISVERDDGGNIRMIHILLP